MCPTSLGDRTKATRNSLRTQVPTETSFRDAGLGAWSAPEIARDFKVASSEFTLEDAYRIAAGGSLRTIRQALGSVGRKPSAERGLLSAASDLLNGHVARATHTLQSEWDTASTFYRPFIADLLAPLYIMADRNADAEGLIDSIPFGHPMGKCLAAIGIVAASRYGRRKSVLEDIDQIAEFAESANDDLLAGKVGQRLALASYYLHDYVRAIEFAEKSLDAFKRAGAERLAVTSHSILYNIHHAVTGDHEEALNAAKRMTASAELAGDRSYQAVGLVAQYEIAAETGDSKLVFALRQRIRQNAVPEQFRERFACRIADFLPCAWVADFERLHAGMALARGAKRISHPMRALATSLMGLSAAALGNRDEARKLALEAVGLSSMAVRKTEAAYDLRYRLLARANASAVYLLVGSTARGVRASRTRQLLSDPDLVGLALGQDQPNLAPCYRGYANAIRSARDVIDRSRLSGPLTNAERNVLLLLAEGYTAAQIASALGRSVSTVRNQTRSIIDKFEVSGRVAAISQARKLGLIT